MIGVECMHCWYWIADLCEEHSIHFILGHALYMKAIHGGKTKNDRIDSFKIAMLMRGGNFPLAYVYPKEMRATRDSLRRRTRIVQHGAMLKAHVVNTTSQYNLPPNRVNLKNLNAHLKWAFSEAAVLYLRGNEKAQRYLQTLQKRMNKAKALSALAHKLGRAAYFMLKHRRVFDEQRFLKG